MEEFEEDNVSEQPKHLKKGNVLPLWGNERTMNMNPLILTNIQSSHYFKVNLYELKTYHEVIDEIFYKVSHLEPWEKGSRKTAGQTGMCGGVRGVGAGGIVSTAYCLLYKLFTLRLTRKQLNGLINHQDSPYLRALGFMYIRYTQPPADLFDWYDDYLEDGEEVDVKAGGGQVMIMGDVLRAFLTKLEWFSTLFPRIPVPIQQKIEKKLNERFPPPPRPAPIQMPQHQQQQRPVGGAGPTRDNNRYAGPPDDYNRNFRSGNRGNERGGGGGGYRDREREWERSPVGGVGGGHRDRERERERSPVRDRERDRSPVRDRERDRDRDRDRPRDDWRRERVDRNERVESYRDPHRDTHHKRDTHGDRGSHRDRGRDREHRHKEERVRSHHSHR